MTEEQEEDGQRFALVVADVYELAGRLRSEGERIAAAGGQTQARWELMSVVSERELTVPQAARRLGITRQGAQRTANDLVDAGLATFTDNPDHRISKLLQLTGSGHQDLAAITARANQFNARLEGALGDRDLATARRVISEMLAALDG